MNNRSLFSDIDGRIAFDREDGDLAYFNALMLKLEFTTKIVVSGMVACIQDDVDRHRYSLEHKLVRANSIGTWVETLNEVLVGAPAQSLLPDAREFGRDLTEQVGATDWRHEAVTQMNRFLVVHFKVLFDYLIGPDIGGFKAQQIRVAPSLSLGLN